MIVVESASRSSIELRSPYLEIPAGATVRLEITHRQPINDSMQELLIRALGQVASSTALDKGCHCKVTISAARPVQAFDALIAHLKDFENY